MGTFPSEPTAHWKYADHVYRTVRLTAKLGEKIDIGEDLRVGRPQQKPKEVWFWDANGKIVAEIPCPCTGVKVIRLKDKSILGDAKLAEYHRLGQLVTNAFAER